MVRLVQCDGRGQGRVHDFALRSLPVILGRAAACGVPLEEVGVEDSHAQVRLVPGEGIWLSACGGGEVMVNGAAVQDVRLQEGDEIELGGAKLEFGFVPTVQRTFRLREWSIWVGIAALTLTQLVAVHLLLP